MKNLKVTIIQKELFWEDPVKNIQYFNREMALIEIGSTDLIVLPEMFTTGFTMNASKNFELMNGKAIDWMKTMARIMKAVICGSIIIREKGKYYNRLIWMNPDGTCKKYDKRHLFRLGGEHKTYTAGNERMIVTLKGWKICPMICYDLRFPAWSRYNQNNKYDVLIYVANWPMRRHFAWKQLLIARAIENQAYVVGANRIGVDGHGVEQAGDSAVINPMGERISKTKPNRKSVETVTLSAKKLIEIRKALPFLLDADKIKLER